MAVLHHKLELSLVAQRRLKLLGQEKVYNAFVHDLFECFRSKSIITLRDPYKGSEVIS